MSDPTANGKEHDAGFERDLREPKACLARIGHGAWCNLPDGHEGEHDGPKPNSDVQEEQPPLFRRQKGMK